MDLELQRCDFGNSLGAREIADSIAEIISVRRVGFNARLPAIRVLARTLGVSPTTTASAYAELERRGLVKGQGRQGTLVARRSADLGSARVFHMGPTDGDYRAIDLSTGYPDPELLLDYENLATGVLSSTNTQSFLNRTVSAELIGPLSELLGVAIEELTVVSGSLDALDRVLEQVCAPGDRVIVEEPNFPPIFDLLDVHRLVAIPVSSDADGIEPASLAKALEMRPTALILQPRAQNPTGISMSVPRLIEVASLLSKITGLTVVEDDHSGMISVSPRTSLRHMIECDVVTIFGFSKSHGPDLRISAIAAPRELISRIVARRRLGPSWTSEILQRILARTLVDPAALQQVEQAKVTYSARLGRLVESIGALGGTIPSKDGLNAWIPVNSELGVITDLARVGVVVAPGSAFYLEAPKQAHIRITTATLDDQLDSITQTLRRWV